MRREERGERESGMERHGYAQEDKRRVEQLCALSHSFSRALRWAGRGGFSKNRPPPLPLCTVSASKSQLLTPPLPPRISRPDPLMCPFAETQEDGYDRHGAVKRLREEVVEHRFTGARCRPSGKIDQEQTMTFQQSIHVQFAGLFQVKD